MAYNLLRCERDQSYLMPPSMRDWLSEGHLAWFTQVKTVAIKYACCTPRPLVRVAKSRPTRAALYRVAAAGLATNRSHQVRKVQRMLAEAKAADAEEKAPRVKTLPL